MAILKDYFQCLSIQKFKKRNQEEYLYLRLKSANGIINGYLWDMVEHFEKRIISGEVYAIKYEEDLFQNKKVIKVKNILPVNARSFDKYGFKSNQIKVSNNEINRYYYDEIINLLLNYKSTSISSLLIWVGKNKKILIKNGYLEHKFLCLEQLNVLINNFNQNVDIDLCVSIIILDRLDINVDSILLKFNDGQADDVSLYLKDNKGFIKKYKYIVDLIEYNFRSCTILTTHRERLNE